MSYAAPAPAAAYLEAQVLSASPGQLVVILFDHLLVSLRRAALAIEKAQPAARAAALQRSRAIVAELRGSLDMERGGALARELDRLYAFVFAELLEAAVRPDATRLLRLVDVVQPLRDGFAGAAGAAAPAEVA